MQLARGLVLVLLACGFTAQVGPEAPQRSGRRSDPCDLKIPDGLRPLLAQEYPAYSLPKVSDNLQEDVEYNKVNGGDGCLGAAVGDFNGDKRPDVALLLKSSRANHSLLTVGLRTHDGWNVERLREMAGDRYRLYVAVAAPGKYRRAESFPDPISERGEIESFESSLAGIVTGRTEASGIYYFWTRDGWVHVWVVD